MLDHFHYPSYPSTTFQYPSCPSQLVSVLRLKCFVHEDGDSNPGVAGGLEHGSVA
jgi:hypothetical protein